MDKFKEGFESNKLIIGIVICLIIISVFYYLNNFGYFDDVAKTEALKIPEDNYNDIIDKILQKQSNNLE